MTVQEMNNRFDVLYDNADQEAPGLNSYEKSLYLTMAANNVVESIVKPITNKGSRSIRDDDANRDKLKGLIDSHVHLTQTLARGLADQVRVPDWLYERILPYEMTLTPDDVYYNSLLIAALLTFTQSSH